MLFYGNETTLNGALYVFALIARDWNVVYLLLSCLLDAFLQRLVVHRSPYAGDSAGFAVLDTEPQVLELGDVVLAQSLILLTWEASHAPDLCIRMQKAKYRETFVLMLQNH